MKLHFVRSIRGLQNFLAIPIMNPAIMNTLAGFMIYIFNSYTMCTRGSPDIYTLSPRAA